MRTIIMLGMLFFTACGKPSEVSYSAASFENLPEGTVNFDRLKSEILAPHCLRCHANASTEKGIQSWIVPGNPDASPLFTQAENGLMPKDESPLSTREIEEIRSYITDAASAPSPSPTPTPIPQPVPPTGQTVSFAEVKSQILVPYRCTSCHNMSTESGAARYINKTHPDASSLYTTAKNGSMPKGGPHVSADKLELLLQYVRDYVNTH